MSKEWNPKSSGIVCEHHWHYLGHGISREMLDKIEWGPDGGNWYELESMGHIYPLERFERVHIPTKELPFLARTSRRRRAHARYERKRLGRER